MNRKIAYIMSRFPSIPETFILREMSELERQGWDIALYPLILQRLAVVHAESEPWIPRVHKLPYLSAPVIAANARAALRAPGVYGSLWQHALWENRTSPNFLVRAMALLPKAVYAARLMQREGVAHIHAHYATHPALVAWLIHRLTGISYSVTVHAHDIFVRTAMLTTKMREASFIAAISEYNRDHLDRVVGPWMREKTHLVHCGIVPTVYAPRPHAAERAARFEIMSIGSLRPYKGHAFLIQACARLRERGLDFRCRIIGEGEQRAELEQLIAHAGLQNWVELVGALPQEQVAHLLPTADCYVQPSVILPTGRMEGIPVALMEALACGLPAVATELSGVPELIRNGTTGVLVPPSDANALADALAAMHADPARAAQMAQAGRELVLREFDLKANVTHLAALFEQVISQRA